MKSTLELIQVNKFVLKEVTYTFTQGQKYLIRGVSGAGKSTLLYLLAGLEKPTTGKVLYNGYDSALFTEHQQQEFLQKHMGLIFQYAYLIPELTVLENVMLKATIAGTPDAQAREQAHALLHQTGLNEAFVNRLPGGLSGGEQQRVSIARALIGKPDFLCADEATAHLDEQNKMRIRDLLYTVQADYGCGLIISSHEPHLFTLNDHELVIQHGMLHEVR